MLFWECIGSFICESWLIKIGYCEWDLKDDIQPWSYLFFWIPDTYPLTCMASAMNFRYHEIYFSTIPSQPIMTETFPHFEPNVSKEKKTTNILKYSVEIDVTFLLSLCIFEYKYKYVYLNANIISACLHWYIYNCIKRQIFIIFALSFTFQGIIQIMHIFSICRVIFHVQIVF